MTPDELRTLLTASTLVAAVQAHAKAEHPNECCGVVDRDGVYWPSPNINPAPADAFTLDPRVIVAHPPIAIVHSHTEDQTRGPSASDMVGQEISGLPWGIVMTNGVGAKGPHFWGDMLPIPPLVGRHFRHGPSGTDGRGDCYAVIRDEMMVTHGIRIPEFPRDDGWWNHGEDLYVTGFERAGFRRIPMIEGEMQAGDVLLMALQYKRIHHGGIITRDLRLLQHLGGKMSAREPLNPWLPAAKLIVRHRDLIKE